MKFEDLKGRVILRIDQNADDSELVFHMENGEVYVMHHTQDCCESVTLEDVCGDFEDVCLWPLHVAEERTVGHGDVQQGDPLHTDGESYTWTFYELATIKGSVTLRWYGTSNGYYSESVSFRKREN